MTNKVLLVFLSVVIAQGTCSLFHVPDFLTKGIASGLSAVTGAVGADDEMYRSGCQTMGFYNTPKAMAGAQGNIFGSALGTIGGGFGSVFSSESSQREICQQRGFFDPSLEGRGNGGNYGNQGQYPPPPQGGGVQYVYDPPTDVYQQQPQYQQYQG